MKSRVVLHSLLFSMLACCGSQPGRRRAAPRPGCPARAGMLTGG